MDRICFSLFTSRHAAVWAALVLLAARPVALRAEPPAPTPTAREVLRKTAEPLIDILARDPQGTNRALALRATVAASDAQPPELIGSHLALYLQPADKALFQFLALGSLVTVCRQGQTFWAAPADKLAPLLAKVEAKPATKADKEPIAPVRLKVPTTLFWLLFRLVPVKDAGAADLNGVACRRLDIKPPDDDDKSGTMRLWIRTDTNAPARLDWRGTDSHSTIVVDDARFLPSLPPETFDPGNVPPATRLPIPADRFRPFMALIGKEEDARRKQMLDAKKANGGTR